MHRRWSLALIALVLSTQPALAAEARQANSRRVVLPVQPLHSALREIARQFRIELLFSSAMLEGESSVAVSGEMTCEVAIARTLAGSRFVARQIPSGAFIIEVRSEQNTPDTQPVPEILVFGERTQNVDIRRTIFDVQPRKIVGREDIQSVHASSLEELIGKRVSADQRGSALTRRAVGSRGAPQSRFNLRGLGSDETLVLIDGRRMPRSPTYGYPLLQSDVNGLSPEAIERVEAITSTAGGIYGPGAIGGVINLILRRDYHGAEIIATNTVSQKIRRIDMAILSPSSLPTIVPDWLFKLQWSYHLYPTRAT